MALVAQDPESALEELILDDDLPELELLFDADAEFVNLWAKHENLVSQVKKHGPRLDQHRDQIVRLVKARFKFRKAIKALESDRDTAAEERKKLKNEIGTLNLEVHNDLKVIHAKLKQLDDDTEMIAEFAKRLYLDHELTRQELADLAARLRAEAGERTTLADRVTAIETGLMQQARLATAEPIMQSLDPDTPVVPTDEDESPTIRGLAPILPPSHDDTTEITEITEISRPRRPVTRQVAVAAVAVAVILFAVFVRVPDLARNNPPAYAASQRVEQIIEAKRQVLENFEFPSLDIKAQKPSGSELSETPIKKPVECQKGLLVGEWKLLTECPDGKDRLCKLASQDATGTYTDCEVYTIE